MQLQYQGLVYFQSRYEHISTKVLLFQNNPLCDTVHLTHTHNTGTPSALLTTLSKCLHHHSCLLKSDKPAPLKLIKLTRYSMGAKWQMQQKFPAQKCKFYRVKNYIFLPPPPIILSLQPTFNCSSDLSYPSETVCSATVMFQMISYEDSKMCFRRAARSFFSD